MDRKQSQFTQVSELSSSDFIPSFGQSSNNKISKSDLFKQIKDETGIFIYPTIIHLKSANLLADPDFPVYVRVEETGYKLYKITSLAAGINDIPLNNGATASSQQEYFVVSPPPSINNAIALFDGAGSVGTLLKNGPVLGAVGASIVQAPNVVDTSYIRINADETVTLRDTAQHKSDISLNNVDNTSDVNKPLSTAAINALNLKSNIDSPAFTGNPTAPNPASGDNDSSIATTAYVRGEIDKLTVASFSALATTPATLNQIATTIGYSTAGIGSREYIAISQAHAITDNVTVINSSTTGIRWRLKDLNTINVEDAGALGYPTDDTAAIQRCIDAFPLGKKIRMYGDKYKQTSTIYLRKQGIFLEGAGLFATDLVFVNVDGGTAIKANADSTIINGAGISGMSFSVEAATTSPSVTIDMSGFSYCEFRNFEINNTRANGVMMKFYSDLGTAPYFNVIDSFSLIGGDQTQTGMQFTFGAWSGGSRGGNANMISNLKRAAALGTLIDLQEGQGNNFVNIGGESIKDNFIVLNNIASAVDSGTASATFAQASLTDSTKAWVDNAFTNYSVLITGGAGAGQCRYIRSNTATVLTTAPPWGKKLDGTSTYSIRRIGAFENSFVNVRQEGNAGNFVKCLPGAIGNKIHFCAISGVANNIVDEAGDPSNQLSNGDLVMFSEVVTPGASANIDLWTKSSVLGGMGVGRNYSVEFLQVNCPGVTAGIATITLDAGGTGVGGGNPSLQVVMDSVIVNNGFAASTNKNPFLSLNRNLFLNITTNADMAAATKFHITVAVRVH